MKYDATLKKLFQLPVAQQREAVAELLMLSGVRGREEGIERGAAVTRRLLLSSLDRRFGQIPAETRERINIANLDLLEHWSSQLDNATSLEQVFQ